MAKVNYSYEKKQRELAKKNKKKEKQLKKAEQANQEMPATTSQADETP